MLDVLDSNGIPLDDFDSFLRSVQRDPVPFPTEAITFPHPSNSPSSSPRFLTSPNCLVGAIEDPLNADTIGAPSLPVRWPDDDYDYDVEDVDGSGEDGTVGANDAGDSFLPIPAVSKLNARTPRPYPHIPPWLPPIESEALQKRSPRKPTHSTTATAPVCTSSAPHSVSSLSVSSPQHAPAALSAGSATLSQGASIPPPKLEPDFPMPPASSSSRPEGASITVPETDVLVQAAVLSTVPSDEWYANEFCRSFFMRNYILNVKSFIMSSFYLAMLEQMQRKFSFRNPFRSRALQPLQTQRSRRHRH